MEIISHRGYWKSPLEKNTEAAFRRSFEAEFGTETDIRDRSGSLVIAHDPPQGGEMSFNEFLSIHAEYGGHLPLALNIKSDGLQPLLKEAIDRFALRNYFVFDMSVPDSIHYVRQNFIYYARQSDHEPQPALLESARGIWLDSFGEEWFTANTIRQHLENSKTVCVVSSELHGREHLGLWSQLRSFAESTQLMLCTDLPEDARVYFVSDKELKNSTEEVR